MKKLNEGLQPGQPALSEIIQTVIRKREKDVEAAKEFSLGSEVQPISTDLHRPYAHLGVAGRIFDIQGDGIILVDFGEERTGAYRPFELVQVEEEVTS